MKKLACEMCGSTDLVKQGGLFVCQFCGTKYSAEEAKKMMVEGTVDVSGSTVKLDTSEELDNLYQIARRARDNNDTASAAKYYEMIQQKAPHDWEAYFFSVYCKAMTSRVIDVDVAYAQMDGSLSPTLGLIKEARLDDQARIAAIDTVWRHTENAGEILGQAMMETQKDITSNALGALMMPKRLLLELCDVFANDETVMRSWALDRLKEREKAHPDNRYVEIIRRWEPEYVAPKQSVLRGCYVATAVYGSYDCPQVWTLRRYRDDTLAQTWYGRAFIRTYYAVSPTLVKWFGDTQWFKNLWKPKLDRLVTKLNQKGVADSPYQDKDW